MYVAAANRRLMLFSAIHASRRQVMSLPLQRISPPAREGSSNQRANPPQSIMDHRHEQHSRQVDGHCCHDTSRRVRGAWLRVRPPHCSFVWWWGRPPVGEFAQRAGVFFVVVCVCAWWGRRPPAAVGEKIYSLHRDRERNSDRRGDRTSKQYERKAIVCVGAREW